MGLLNRIGIGAAEVDTVLETETVRPGDSIPARVEVEGGSDDQEVEAVELELQARYQYHPKGSDEDDFTYRTKTLVDRELDGFTISPGDEWVEEIAPIEVPVYTPATISQTEVWVKTRLDIEWAVDPTDKDPLTVEPGPHLSAMIDALEDLGFVLDFADNCPAGEFGRFDEYAQFFEYEDYGDTPFDGIDDLEMSVEPYEDRLEVGMNVESRAGGSSKKTIWTEFTLDSADPDDMKRTFRREIRENS